MGSVARSSRWPYSPSRPTPLGFFQIFRSRFVDDGRGSSSPFTRKIFHGLISVFRNHLVTRGRAVPQGRRVALRAFLIPEGVARACKPDASRGSRWSGLPSRIRGGCSRCEASPDPSRPCSFTSLTSGIKRRFGSGVKRWSGWDPVVEHLSPTSGSMSCPCPVSVWPGGLPTRTPVIPRSSWSSVAGPGRRRRSLAARRGGRRPGRAGAFGRTASEPMNLRVTAGARDHALDHRAARDRRRRGDVVRSAQSSTGIRVRGRLRRSPAPATTISMAQRRFWLAP